MMGLIKQQCGICAECVPQIDGGSGFTNCADAHAAETAGDKMHFTKERLQEISEDGFLKHGESKELARIVLAALTAPSEPVYQYRIRNCYNGQVTEWQTIKRDQVDFVLKAQPHNAEFQIIAPAAPVVPDAQHSERFNWTYGEWAEHLGGHHQNNDPANYYEFGSFMAVAEMLRQFGKVQHKAGWNACRAAMLAAVPQQEAK